MTVTEVCADQGQRVRGHAKRVLVVDDHETFAELLAKALASEDDFECVGIAHSAAVGFAAAVKHQPDIVVMDIQLGAESGLAAAQRIRGALPEVVVAVLSAHGDPSWVAKAAQSGASAFAPKSGSLAELLSVLRRARNGGMLVAPSLFQERVATAPTAQLESPLSAREIEVLALMGRGSTPHEIARVLGITVNTCRGHVKSIHAKLNVRSQLEAVVKAQRLGLLAISDAS